MGLANKIADITTTVVLTAIALVSFVASIYLLIPKIPLVLKGILFLLAYILSVF